MSSWNKRPEAGQYWLVALYANAAQKVGRSFASLVLPFIASYFLLTRRVERRESRRFLARALQRPVGLADVYRHFHTFAQVVLDRIYLLSSDNLGLSMEVEGLEELEAVLDQHRGCLLLGAHLGSFEASRILSQHRPEVAIRILMDREVNANVSSLLERVNPALASQLIDSSAGSMATMLTIRETFAQGGLVAILGDRSVEADTTTVVDFLGGRVALPTAPYLISAVTRVPIMLFFGFYIGGGHYKVTLELLTTGDAIPRRSRTDALHELCQRYADRLAHYASAYPYNWFNFFPFWESEKK